jgi:Cu/Ag efflux pump CusA
MLQPLAIAVIGGLLSSIVLSLILTPIIHYYLHRRSVPAPTEQLPAS